VLCCVWLEHNHDSVLIDPQSNQMYTAYQMIAIVIEAMSDESFVSI